MNLMSQSPNPAGASKGSTDLRIREENDSMRPSPGGESGPIPGFPTAAAEDVLDAPMRGGSVGGEGSGRVMPLWTIFKNTLADDGLRSRVRRRYV